ncbi:hypothetical protein [Paenibacillus taichungensis]|uniref:hypothetical protein n=1 Tax=Paenibacillus taichungensis TaxID=484184 RepID=UPI0035DF528E
MDWTEAKSKVNSETFSELVKQQLSYEEEEKDNDCQNCGKNNKGVIVLWGERATLQHAGLWVDGACVKCGKMME